jgi:hypothetical protein
MGEEYLAQDAELDRIVTLKFSRLKSRNQDRRRRFTQEAKAAAALNRPNIQPGIPPYCRGGETVTRLSAYATGEMKLYL